jgi:hypothetical protein
MYYFFGNDTEFALTQLVNHAFAVSTFEQTRSKRAMNLDAAFDDQV